ncbi:uncharacterized protein LOC106465221 [Limulus polyphemus]|uniref:Uncharacterized protein LOC106465221 n=1 Tax=Limulus polyphemus TaxID=6850 RepID=A0ABM1BFD6_LIMPO|nr:uncharacterized protein LOC106465221 [Limulus polyphemus]
MMNSMLLCFITFLLPTWTSARLEQCTCSAYMLKGKGVREENFVTTRDYVLPGQSCDKAGDEYCKIFCLKKFYRKTGGGDLDFVPPGYKGRSIGEISCIGIGRDVTNERMGVFSKACKKGDFLDTGFLSKQNLCCKGKKYIRC